jgi:hypothetical protein
VVYIALPPLQRKSLVAKATGLYYFHTVKSLLL